MPRRQASFLAVLHSNSKGITFKAGGARCTQSSVVEEIIQWAITTLGIVRFSTVGNNLSVSTYAALDAGVSQVAPSGI